MKIIYYYRLKTSTSSRWRTREERLGLERNGEIHVRFEIEAFKSFSLFCVSIFG
jgi:hypothetical protein